MGTPGSPQAASAPFRLKVEPDNGPTLELVKKNVLANTDLRKIRRCSSWHNRKLAVVGGAPSLADHLDELRNWDGDIWGINYTAGWLCRQGIKATMVALDPREWNPLPDRTPALLATACSPRLFERLRGMDVQAFDLADTHEDGLVGGWTTVTRMPALAFTWMGYKDVTFFGCDSSWSLDGDSHINARDANPCLVIIRTGDKDHVTTLEFMAQAEQLATVIRTFPAVFKNASGGLLKGMLEHFDTWHVQAVSEALKHYLESLNQGRYDEPYTRP